MAQAVAEELGGIPMSPALQATLLRAREYAADQTHREVTLEHLLLSLSEDDDAAAVMVACQVDLGRLRHDVAGFLGNLADRSQQPQQPAISLPLTQILKYATLAAQQGRRPRIDGAIVLAAIVGDGKSMAASFLKSQGLTFEQAVRVLQQSIRDGGRAPSRPELPPPPAAVPPAPRLEAPREQSPVLAPEPPPAAAPSTDAEDILAAARARVVSRVPRLQAGEAAPLQPAPQPQPLQADAQPPAIPAARPESASRFPPPQPNPRSDDADALEIAAWPEDPSPAEPVQNASATAPQAPAAAGSWTPPAAPPAHASPFPPARPPLPPLVPLGGAPRPPASPPALNAPSALQPPQASPPPWGAPPERRPGPQHPPSSPVQAPPPMQRTGPPQQGFDAAQHAQGASAPRSPAIELAQLSHSIPSRLVVGRPRTIEVQIKRQPLAAPGSASRPAPQRGDVVTARAISVRVRPAKGRFIIDQPSTETQWDKASDGSRLAGEAAVWRFTIQPMAKGEGELLLTVSARTIAADGMILESALPDQVIPVRIGRDWPATLRRAGIIALVGLGSVVVETVLEALTSVDLLKLVRALLRF